MLGKMKRKISGKRVISFMLSIILLATSVQVNAFAQEITTNPVETIVEEVLETKINESQENQTKASLPEDMTQEEYAEWKEAYLESMAEDELTLAYANSYTGNYIRNDYIEAYIGSDGKFTMGTVNGSTMATDNHLKLLYGHPNPWSSYTTVKLDGQNYTFTAQSDWVETPDAIKVSHTIGNVVTTQSLSFVENEYSGEPDTIAISYTTTNYDDVRHEVGIRIMLDTMLGSNDGSPFRIPGYGNVTEEREFVGNDIPQNWMTFDSLDSPRIIANGCFYRSLEEKPDKVQFTAWGGVHGTSWNYVTSPDRKVTGDSAVAAYYDPKPLEPGESRTVTTYYGIGSFTASDSKPPLSTSIAAPSELKANTEEGGYIHNPFSIIAYVQNNGNGDAINVKAKLNLPEDCGLQLISPINPEQTLGNIGVGQEVPVTWMVYAESQAKKKTAKYSVTVSADNESAKTVNVSTILGATRKEADNFTIKLNKKKLELDVPENTNFQLTAECSDGKQRNITWLSTNPSVAKVDKDGVVKAVGAGYARIVAMAGTRNAVCGVEVDAQGVISQESEESSETLNTEIQDTIALSTGPYTNGKVNLNLYNKGMRTVGNLYVELLDQDKTILSLGQEITLESDMTQVAQLDVKSLLIYPHNRICTYVMDDSGKMLSNKIYLDSSIREVDEFDLLTDKEHLILKKGDSASVIPGLSVEGWELVDLEFASTDKNVVTVDYDGDVTAVGEGTAIVTVGSKNLEIYAECKIVVVGSTPVQDYKDSFLHTKNVTVDLAKEEGALLQFTSIYNQNASDAFLDAMGVSENSIFESSVTESLKLEDEELRELFDIRLVDDATAILVPTAKAADSPEYAKKTYTTNVLLKLKGSQEEKEIGELTIQTIYSLPQLKATAGTLDSYYKDITAEVVFKNKGKVVEDVVSVSVDPVADSTKNPHPEFFTYDNEKKVLILTDANRALVEEGKYQVRLLVNLKEYAVPVKVTTAVEVKDSLPEVKLDSDVLRLRAVPEETQRSETSGRYAYMQLLIPQELTGKRIEEVKLNGENVNIFDVKPSEDHQGILIRNTSAISGVENYEIVLRYENTAKDIILPLTIQAVTGDLGYRISAQSVEINKVSINGNIPSAKVRIGGSADNDIVNSCRFTEIVNRQEKTYLTNVSMSYEPETGLITITPGSKTGTFKVRIYPEGYDRGFDLSVKVYAKYPTYKVSKSTLNLNTQTRETQTIYITNNMGASNEFSYTIRDSYNRYPSIGSITTGNGYISITPNAGATNGKYKLMITPNNGNKTLTVTLKVSDKAPKFTLSSGKVKLNSKIPYTAERAELTIKSNPTGFAYENFTFYQLDSRGREYSVTDFDITKGTDGKIYISRKHDLVAKGTYTIRAKASSFTKAKKLTFKVIVEDKEITFKQKGSIVLNSSVTSQAEKAKINLTTQANISNLGEFKFYEQIGRDLLEPQNVTITKESDGYYVALNSASDMKKGNVQLVAESLTYTNAKDTKIKLKVVDKIPGMKATFTGKIDSVNPESFIEAKLTMKDNNIQMNNEGKISIDNANFSLYDFRPENNTVLIRLADNADMSAKNAKKATIAYEDVHGNKVETGEITIPVKTSKVSLKSEQNLYEIYLADKTDEALIQLQLKGTTGAVVESVEFAKAEDAEKFEIRCVSKATRKYALGIIDEKAVAAKKYKIKLNIKVKGLAKAVATTVQVQVK